MSIASGQELAKYYGSQDVFSNLNFSIARGDKIALVGPNGAGKTTLLRMIAGLDEPTEGSMHRSRGLRIGYLPQRPEFQSDQTVRGEMLTVFSRLREQQRSLLQLAEQMSAARDPGELMVRYAKAEERFELAGGYDYENRITRVLDGLGFGPGTYDRPMSCLSGGEVTRALLAKLLLQEPELLLLDEPANYLDLEALEWLESHLQAWPHTLLIISHDRYLLDKVALRVWELRHGKLGTYRGNYSEYVAQRQARRARLQRSYDTQREFIAKTEEFIRRYKAGQRSKEARGREKRLRRLERVEAPRRQHRMRLQLSTHLRSGDNVLMSDAVLIGYRTGPAEKQGSGLGSGRHLLFKTGGFLIQRGERVALLGPNGSGKTTFLRAILGEVQPIAGHLRVGASVRIGYLPQTQDWLEPSQTVLQQILDISDFTIEEARRFLGRFLFSGDLVLKETGTLSGGELTRLTLAVLTVRGANFLLLDEPTTHLDVESREVLQEVLLKFNGTILFVSHDRYLIDALATHVWVIQQGEMQTYEGNYSSYLEERERVLSPGLAADPASPEGRDERRRRERAGRRPGREELERLGALEVEIDDLEKELDGVASMIDLASAAQDAPRVRSLGLEYQQLAAALSESIREWERLAVLERDQK